MKKGSTLKGPERLKSAIAKLPARSEILWLESTVGVWKRAKGSEPLKRPPAELIAEVRRYCESRQITLRVD
jgi:hypothetical protein